MAHNTYTIRKKWKETTRFLTYHCEEKQDERSLVMKTLRSDYPSHLDLSRLRSEFTILKKLDHQSIPKVIDIYPHENNLRLVMEHPQGVPLLTLSKQNQTIRHFLKIAIPLVESVAYLHANRIIHKNLNPSNIFYNDDSGLIQLGGFELAAEQSREALLPNLSEAFDANLAYISPEQTGRMNRALDQRSDLYSLGSIFYCFLAERPPFETSDPLEMIHCHIAKEHKSLYELMDKVPLVISKIVDKLLATNSDQRYQSALGLLHDLRLCNNQLVTKSKISDFDLGLKDVSDKFILSGKLYGRSDEIIALQKAYENAKENKRELLFVTGPSGMGKSALVNELKKYVDQNRGFFIRGKFDQIKKNTPLSSLFSALSQLVKQVLVENNQRIKYWRHNILNAVGTNGQVLIDMIPEVELLIGKQNDVPGLPVAEANTRFNLVLNNFIQVFASPQKPLIIFIDDLQWVDSTTCQWIESQFIYNQLDNILLIGAYRDNEVNPSHPLMIMKDHLIENDVNINTLELEALTTESISFLIADSLNFKKENCDEVAEIVFQKTHGNPFFTRQLLLSLYENEAINFDSQEQSWSFDLDRIRRRTISDNVIDLMLHLLQRLPQESQSTLKAASCIGSEFDLSLLSEVRDQEVGKTIGQLSDAVKLGMIASSGDEASDFYSFQHDRIQQTAFSLLAEQERKELHLKIGNLLLSQTKSIEDSDEIYNIADHLNAASDLLVTEAEMTKLIEINRLASLKAKSSTAYQPALSYINQSIQLMNQGNPDLAASVSYQFYVQKAEAEHLCGHNEEAEKYFDVAISTAKTDIDKAKVYIKLIHFYNNLGKFKEAYETGRLAISPLGVKLPPSFIPPQLIKELLQYRFLKGKRKIEDLIEVNEMSDEKRRLAVLLMADVTKSAYQIRPELSIVVAAKIVNEYLKHGHADGSCVGFIAFGSIFHGAIMNQKEAGYEFGLLTLDMVERHQTYRYKSEVHFVVGYFAVPWIKPAAVMENYWRIAYNSGLEVGDFFHASCAACGMTMSYFMRGVSFSDNIQLADRYLDFLVSVNYTEGILTVQGIIQAIKNLQGETKSRTSFSDEDSFDEEKYLVKLDKFGSRHFAHYYFINKMRTLYLWGEIEEALNVAKLSDGYLKDSPGMLHTAEHFYYKALILAAKCSKTKGSPPSKYIRTLRKINIRFKKYAKRCPSNFEHKSFIIEAEYNRVRGKTGKAQNLYYDALQSAKTYNYLHVQALANVLLTRYHLGENNNRIAGFHLRDAVYEYNALGAVALVNYLQERHHDIFTNIVHGEEISMLGASNLSRMSRSNNIDLNTILKSSEAISQQIRLNDLLSTMMKIIIENAGADRMVLLLKNGEKLSAQAECKANESEVRILDVEESNNYDDVADSVVNYVWNSKDHVILDEAIRNEKFGQDSYIERTQAKSILCAPLSKLGETIGVIYLENNLASGVFTQNRIDLVILLSGQMAISIENAKLYDNLEIKVEERTMELNKEKEKSEQLLLNILPASIAQELKKTGKAQAKQFDEVTVLFADFRNFSQICEKLEAKELVSELNYFYTAFDKIIIKHGAEKIKTIGDCYMCAGGLSEEVENSALTMIRVAMDIQQFMVEEASRREGSSLEAFSLRIGLHTGPVVAGIVGLKKFAYDIWGDTVNVAARMESSGEIGRINVSEFTYDLIKDNYDCTYRGKIEVKNKGKIDMYFVDHLRETTFEA